MLMLQYMASMQEFCAHIFCVNYPKRMITKNAYTSNNFRYSIKKALPDSSSKNININVKYNKG